MDYTKKKTIEELVDFFMKNQTNENFSLVIESLVKTEVILVNSKLSGDLRKLNNDGVTPLVITDSEKKNYIPLFTSDAQIINDQIKNLERTNYVFSDLCNESIINNDYIEGYVLNPFTQGLKLPKPVIEIVIKYKNEL